MRAICSNVGRTCAHPLGEIPAFDVLLNDEGHIVQLLNIVNGDQHRMLESSRGASLDQEFVQLSFICKPVGPRNLERDLSIELRVERQVDDAEAALAQNPPESRSGPIG